MKKNLPEMLKIEVAEVGIEKVYFACCDTWHDKHDDSKLHNTMQKRLNKKYKLRLAAEDIFPAFHQTFPNYFD